MKNKIIFVLVSLFLFLESCDSKKENLKLEYNVYQDIFPELVDKTFKDYRKLPVPPPPYSPDSPNNEHSRKYKDKEEMNEAFRGAMENYKIYVDTTDFTPLYVIVNDSAMGFSKERLRKIHDKDFYKAKFIDTTVFKKTIKIDLSDLDLGGNYIVKHKSDFSKSIEELKNTERLKYPVEKKHFWQFSGELNLTRVYFNKEQTYAFLDVGFYCGKLCGCSYRVFVKKEGKKWIIDKIENLGCS